MSNRERQIIYDITYMWNLKITQMNLYTKQKQTHRHRKQTYGYEREEGGRDKLRVWDLQMQTTTHKTDKKIYCIAQGIIFNNL